MPRGAGHVTAKGYLRVSAGGRQRLLHDVVWEQANGAIPGGMEIHHIDEDKLNNALSNLHLVTPLEHKRIHSPYYRRAADGSWERRCGGCGAWKPACAEHFYLNGRGWIMYGRCRPCRIADVTASKRRRAQVVKPDAVPA